MILDKLQGQVVTHSQEVEWWRIIMVECVNLELFGSFDKFLQNWKYVIEISFLMFLLDEMLIFTTTIGTITTNIIIASYLIW